MASSLTRRPLLLATAGYAVIALLQFWPLPMRLGTHMPGAPFGDPLLNAWILAWDADRLADGLRGLWNAPIFHPYPDTLAWSEHLLGIAVFVAPAYWMTHNLVLPYNLALLGSVVLAGVGMYLLAYELTGRRPAAWLAGTMFACLPYRIAHVSHLQVLMAGWMPLALLGLHRYFRTGSYRALAGFAAAFLLTALSNGYYLFFLALAVSIVACWQLAGLWRQGLPLLPVVTGLGIAAIAILVALSPIIAPYVRVQQSQGFTRTRSEMVMFSAAPPHYVKVNPDAQRWSGLLQVGRSERQLFPGITLTLLAVVGVCACWRMPRARPYALLAPVAVLLSFGPAPDLGVVSLTRGPYDLLLAVPGVDGLRVPARLAMIVYLAMCVLAATGVAWMACRVSPRALGVVTAILTIAVVAEGLPARPLVTSTRALGLSDRAYQWLTTQPEGAVLELPAGRDRQTVKYMAGTLIHRHPIVNGYSGHGSALEDLFAGPASLEPSQADALLEAAAAVGVRYVLVHEHLYRDRAYAARLANALRAASPTMVRAAHVFDSTMAIVVDAPAAARRASVDPALSLAGCDISASHAPATAGRAVDGNRETRWVSGTPQEGTEWLAISCPETRILTGLEVLFSRRSLSSFPRRLVIERSTDGITFHTIFDGSILPALAQDLAVDGRQPYAHLSLPPGEFTVVRLRQLARAERPSFWAIDELILRGH